MPKRSESLSTRALRAESARMVWASDAVFDGHGNPAGDVARPVQSARLNVSGVLLRGRRSKR